MNELIAVALFTILAVISPGADFAMVTRSSYAFGRRAGLSAALGIALGVQVHVLYTVFGIAVIISQTPALFMAMKVVGAGYLVYLGYKSLTNTTKISLDDGDASSRLGVLAAFRSGFLTNAMNPKTMLFVVSAYTQVVQPGSSLLSSLGYGLFMSAAHWVWFSLVAVFFSSHGLRRIMLERQILVDRLIGVALIGLGVAVVMASVR
ncbi:LysE family translocator [Pseudomonas sp. GD03860]|uniref:LysE family translocator n=1 Tax=Pseudomonas TaxID=286 RepID=UPI0023635DEB|nr:MULTISPECIES: LysE family translocator [Pseudomonas]MDD2060735.1 LysE family translocator [Pseudomonas putida]MDH0637689.1 LysE family translocator [Pseudomonas sp. GD03860]